MNKIVSCGAVIALLFPEAVCAAQPATMGWPEVIARVTQERQQAEICVGMLKSSKNTDALADAKATYETAKPRVDGLIAGLTAALVEGGKPEALPTIRNDLETSANDLKEICGAALKTRKATAHQKGGWQEAIAEAAIEATVKPLADWLGEKWTRLMEPDKLEIETKKAQLEAARWPKFGDIAAQ